MIKCLEIDKSAANALEASGLYPNDKKRTHLLKSLYGTYKGDAQMDETEMFAAFENGLYFYNLWIMYQMDIRHKPYYCRLFLKHATPENNNFISPETDKEQVRKEIDSSFTATMEQYKNVKGMEKQMKKSQKMLEAKMLGNIKEYSDILDDTSMHTSMTAMDRIECLFILGKKEEALKFAKKIKSKLIVMDTPITNNCAAAIDNIIAGSCN